MPNQLPTDPSIPQQWWGWGVGLGGLLLTIWGRIKARPGLSEAHVERIYHEKLAELKETLRVEMRTIVRDEIAEEFRWRSYGQRLSQLERDKEESR